MNKMKKTCILFFLSFFSTLMVIAADNDPVVLETKPEAVTVFLSGAEVYRSARANLKTGQTEVIFRGLENNINPNSIQVSAPDNVIMMSVRRETSYLNTAPLPPKAKKLQDSLDILNDLITREQNTRSALSEEKQMILANQKLAGQNVTVSAEQLRQMAEFYRTRLNDIYDRLFKSNKKDKRYRDRISAINRQLNEMNAQRNRPTNDIVVTFQAFASTSANVAVKYLVNGPRWSPRYDLRAKNTDAPVTLNYRADVYQATGIDWDNVMLTLSTANPNLSGTKPSLAPWYLYPQQVFQPQTRGAKNTSNYYAAPKVAEESAAYDNAYDDMDEAELTLADYTTVQSNATTVEFKIKIPQDLPADGRAHGVIIQDNDLPAFFEHYAVPKLDRDAFLLAGVLNWEDLNLLPGPVSIYFEGTYIGQSQLNTSYTEDTLYFSMGRDKGIVITREKLKGFCESKILGTQKEKTTAWEIKIRNTKSSEVTLNLEDQVPVPMDEDFKVKVLDLSDGKQNKDSGIVKWELKLAPKETKTLRLMYSVKHPKNKVPSGTF